MKAWFITCCRMALCCLAFAAGSTAAWAIQFEDGAQLTVDEIEVSIFLIGDAGEPGSSEKSLSDLRSMLEDRVREVGRERTFAFFLGDNIYPAGLGESALEPRRRLDNQLAAFGDDCEGERPRGVFLAGNHDWRRREGEQGLQRLCRQADYIEEQGCETVAMMPAKGCPGPESLDIGEHLTIVTLDSEWLRRNSKRRDTAKSRPTGCDRSSPCGNQTPGAVFAALRSEVDRLGRQGRRVVVAAHHPLVSGGPHQDGASLWRRILRRIPLLRRVAAQDLDTPRYRRMIARMNKALADLEYPPLLHAAGHDHGLQLVRFPDHQPFCYQAVSGAGSATKVDHLKILKATRGTLLYPRFQGLKKQGAVEGFMRLDVAKDGRAHLSIWDARNNVWNYSAPLQDCRPRRDGSQS